MAHEAAIALAWLISTLNGDSQMNELSPGGSYRAMAPPGTATPFNIVQFQSGRDITTINGVRLFADSLWQIKAVAEATKTATAFSAASEIDALFRRTSGSNAGGLILSCIREEPLQYDSLEGGVQWVYAGGLYRLLIQQA